MTPDDVHDNEMPKLPDDQWPADDPVLASFAEDLRMVAGGPAPEPRPGLVAVMRQGAVPVEPIAGRRKMLVKSVLGSLAAKVALGVGVAAASVTAAGAAGMLPAPAQDAVASVVAATTPFQLPTSSDVTSLVAGEDGSTTTSSTVTSTSTTLVHTSTTLARTGDDDDAVEGGGTGTGTDRTVNHGACVSTAAKDKSNDDGNHGKTVSSVAKSDCGKDATGGSTSTTIAGGTTTTSSTTTSVANGSRTNNSGPGSSNSGKGNSGNGNSGKGNSGN